MEGSFEEGGEEGKRLFIGRGGIEKPFFKEKYIPFKGEEESKFFNGDFLKKNKKGRIQREWGGGLYRKGVWAGLF